MKLQIYTRITSSKKIHTLARARHTHEDEITLVALGHVIVVILFVADSSNAAAAAVFSILL